jgi:hypothetical protein
MSSLYAQDQEYRDVFQGPQTDNAVSVPVLAAGFNDIQFYLDVDQDSTPDYEIQAFISNQDKINPPNPALPSGPGNDYDQVMYKDLAGGVNYDTNNPYNPSSGNFPKSFKILPQGAVWVFLKIVNYADGVLTKADINLFNNN